MRTQQYIDNQANLINQSLTAIEDLQRQLDELRQEVRVSQQLHQAQQSAQSELSKWLQQGKKLLKDCSGVFPESFLDDLVQEVSEIAEEIKTNYDSFSQSDRFLNSETQEQQDTAAAENTHTQDYQDFNLLVEFEDMPPENDDISILSTNQVLTIIKPLDKLITDKIKTILGLTNKLRKIESIAEAISQKKITHKKLLELIQFAESEQLLLNGFNGNGKH